MAEKIITFIIIFMILLSFGLYCFAEETPERRPFNSKELGETFNTIAGIIILFGLALALIGRILNRRSRNYSCSGNDFGGNFKDSSGGIYFGDGFRGIGGRYFPGSGSSVRGRR